MWIKKDALDGYWNSKTIISVRPIVWSALVVNIWSLVADQIWSKFRFYFIFAWKEWQKLDDCHRYEIQFVNSCLSTPVEIWNEDFTEGSDIGFSLANGSYGYGISAFLVPPGFCSKNWFWYNFYTFSFFILNLIFQSIFSPWTYANW